METLENNNCTITYNPICDRKTGVFGGRDLTDNYNMPAFYNTTVRGHKKAWEKVKEQFNDKTTMSTVEMILLENGIRTHSWCMMD